MYNLGLYNTRQYYFENNRFLKYVDNYAISKENENYKLLQAASAQQTLKMVERGMFSFFGLLKIYREGKIEKPSIPHYLPKDGVYMVVYPKNAFSIKNGVLQLGVSREFAKQYPNAHELLQFELPKPLKDKAEYIQEVHILPSYDGRYYRIKYTYKEQIKVASLDESKYLSIDLGRDNYATFVDTTGTTQIICGRYIKSVNQWYNKENARLQSIKDKQGIKRLTNRQHRLLVKRNSHINEYMNRAVDHIIKHCLNNKIGNVAIGELKEIKQNINLGHKTNQEYVQIPNGLFKQKLESKCQQHGIKYHLVNEAYTSRTDSLAMDEIKDQPYGKSRRIERGLYKSITGTLLNADVNGAINILRKVAGDSVVKQIAGRGLVNRPRRIRLSWEQESKLLSNQTATTAVVASPAL